jgi:hypothetical protein
MFAKTFFQGYEGKQAAHEVLNNSVWFETKFPTMPIDWRNPWTEIKSEIESIAQSEQFIVVHVMPVEDVIDKVYDIAMNFNSNYEVVLPSELASLKTQSVRTPYIPEFTVPSIIASLILPFLLVTGKQIMKIAALAKQLISQRTKLILGTRRRKKSRVERRSNPVAHANVLVNSIRSDSSKRHLHISEQKQSLTMVGGETPKACEKIIAISEKRRKIHTLARM